MLARRERADVEYTASAVEPVLGDENLSTRRIQEIALSMRKKGEHEYSSPLNCNLKFVRQPRYDGIRIFVSIKDTDRDWAFALTEELDTHIQRTLSRSNKWLNKFLSSSFVNDLLIPTLVFGVVLLWAGRLPIATMRLSDLVVKQFALLMFVLVMSCPSVPT